MKVIRRGIVVSILSLIILLVFKTPDTKKKENMKLLFPPVVIYAKKPHVSSKGGLQTFLKKMARIESDNNSRAVNRYGMLGKYQFAPSTIRSLGVHVTNEEFLNNERLQDEVMVKYMKSNANELQFVIKKFSGTRYRGVDISKSGIIAAAHLTGTVGVLAFFYPDKYHHRLSDGNGTTVSSYIQKFNNYKINF